MAAGDVVGMIGWLSRGLGNPESLIVTTPVV